MLSQYSFRNPALCHVGILYVHNVHKKKLSNNIFYPFMSFRFSPQNAFLRRFFSWLLWPNIFSSRNALVLLTSLYRWYQFFQFDMFKKLGTYINGSPIGFFPYPLFISLFPSSFFPSKAISSLNFYHWQLLTFFFPYLIVYFHDHVLHLKHWNYLLVILYIRVYRLSFSIHVFAG